MVIFTSRKQRDVSFGEFARRVSRKLGELRESRKFFRVPTARCRRHLKKHLKKGISNKRANRLAGIYAQINKLLKKSKNSKIP
jgi:hypothetical protein